MSDATRSTPRRAGVSFRALMFGACAAPIFWLGQMMLGYGVSAFVCYGGDHPATVEADSALRGALISFDAIAVVAAVLGLLVSYSRWRGAREPKDPAIGADRAKFMAIWGIWSSACFLLAILFSTIASITVPLCLR
jgi:hypothetical protein